MMLNNLKVDRTAVMQTKESAQPIASTKIEDTTITGNATTDSSSIVDNIPMVKVMNPILKYSLMGIGGALVIFLGYKFIFKRK
jgi:Na+/H+ antiporter NhaD/arsenite permease-like protein